MVILGIDPGFAIVGFGLLRSERGRQALINCGAITTQAGLSLPTRLVQIEDDMKELLTTFRPDAIAIEELFFNNNITTGIGVAQAQSGPVYPFLNTLRLKSSWPLQDMARRKNDR